MRSAGFLGPVLVFVLGDRLRHCPPAVEPTLFATYSHNYSMAEATAPAVIDDPAWQLAAVNRLKLSWGLDDLKFVTIAGKFPATWDVLLMNTCKVLAHVYVTFRKAFPRA